MRQWTQEEIDRLAEEQTARLWFDREFHQLPPFRQLKIAFFMLSTIVLVSIHCWPLAERSIQAASRETGIEF